MTRADMPTEKQDFAESLDGCRSMSTKTAKHVLITELSLWPLAGHTPLELEVHGASRTHRPLCPKHRVQEQRGCALDSTVCAVIEVPAFASDGSRWMMFS